MLMRLGAALLLKWFQTHHLTADISQLTRDQANPIEDPFLIVAAIRGHQVV
jgi:hypothetical protein